MINLSKQDVKESRSTLYHLLNSKLYQLCKDHFKHKSPDAILAKTIIIGRTYAVSLDRGKDKNKTEKEKKLKFINDDFYQKEIVPRFQNPKLDIYLSKLKRLKSPENHIKEILALHYYLTDLLVSLNGEDKRSFSSKYLHFHLPDLFFLYDSRAKSVINQFIKRKDVEFYTIQNSDKEYSTFYSKAIHLQNRIRKQHGILLTPRQIDNLFLKNANERLRNKKPKAKEK